MGNTSYNAKSGVYGGSNTSGGSGIAGLGAASGSFGVNGTGFHASAVGVQANNPFGGTALAVSGKMTITSSSLVSNLYAARANVADSASSVSGGNVSGAVATANFANSATTCTTASNSNALGGAGFPASSWARIFPTNSGTANASGSGINIYVTGTLNSSVRTRGTSNFVYIENTSDRNLKTNENPETFGLDFVNLLQPKTFEMIANPGILAHGLIAQDVQELIPEDDNLVQANSDGTLGFDYNGIVSPLIKAIQELSVKVDALESTVESLTNP